MGCHWLQCVNRFLGVPFRSRGFGWGWVLPFAGFWARFRLGWRRSPGHAGQWGVVVWCLGGLLFGLFGILRADEA